MKAWGDGLRYVPSSEREGEELLDADGMQVMMPWEQPYMERCVEELNIDESSHVLEVGFGCGFSAEYIQGSQPASHTIIECAGTVLKRLRRWAAGRPGVRVVEGSWQTTLPSLGQFDAIFFDDFGSPGLGEAEIARCPDGQYREEYRRARSHFHAFVRIALRWHSRVGTRITGFMLQPLELGVADCDVCLSRMRVHPPPHCRYVDSSTVYVPRFTKKRAGEAGGGTKAARRVKRVDAEWEAEAAPRFEAEEEEEAAAAAAAGGATTSLGVAGGDGSSIHAAIRHPDDPSCLFCFWGAAAPPPPPLQPPPPPVQP